MAQRPLVLAANHGDIHPGGGLAAVHGCLSQEAKDLVLLR